MAQITLTMKKGGLGTIRTMMDGDATPKEAYMMAIELLVDSIFKLIPDDVEQRDEFMEYVYEYLNDRVTQQENNPTRNRRRAQSDAVNRMPRPEPKSEDKKGDA